MISSRVNCRYLIAAQALCVGLAVTGPVAAQAPMALPSASQVPQETAPAISAPQPLAPPRSLLPRSTDGTDRDSATPTPEAISDPQVKTGIQIDGLGQIDHESVGVLSPLAGGLGGDLWRGLTRSQAVSLISGLPSEPTSRALRDLTVRLLLSRAQAPAIAVEQPPSLLVARAEALASMGDVDALSRLMSAAPTQGRPMGMDQLDAILSLLAYDNARVCGLARNNLALAASDFWQRLLIFCDALDGRTEGVTLGLSLLRESAGDDPALVLLTDALLNSSPILIDAIEQPNLVHLALSRAAEVALPEFVNETTPRLVLRGAAQAPNLSLGARIDAAERAVDLGILGVEALQQLYTQVPFQPADIADALTRADETGGAAARALLYQAAVGNNIPVARAEIISRAFDLAREDDRYIAAVMAFKPLIDRLPPSPEMSWFALTGLRAYVSIGETVGAERWLALLRASASVRLEVQPALVRIRPLAWLLGARDPGIASEQMLRDWHESVSDQSELTALRSLVNGMFLALGETVPIDLWPSGDVAPQTQTMPPSPLWFRFRDSLTRATIPTSGMPSTVVARGPVVPGVTNAGVPSPTSSTDSRNTVEPLLLLLQVIGSLPAESLGPAVVYDAISALRTLGHEETARKFAVEMALSAGL